MGENETQAVYSASDAILIGTQQRSREPITASRGTVFARYWIGLTPRLLRSTLAGQTVGARSWPSGKHGMKEVGRHWMGKGGREAMEERENI